jgi:hypothetical protein
MAFWHSFVALLLVFSGATSAQRAFERASITDVRFVPPLASLPGSAVVGEVTLTPQSQLRSFMSFGDTALFLPVARKLVGGEALRVLAVGGSVTCGAKLGLDDSVPEDAWPSTLAHRLNLLFPTHSGVGHEVLNMAESGVTTSHWLNRFSTWLARRKHTDLEANPWSGGEVDMPGR